MLRDWAISLKQNTGAKLVWRSCLDIKKENIYGNAQYTRTSTSQNAESCKYIQHIQRKMREVKMFIVKKRKMRKLKKIFQVNAKRATYVRIN